MLIRLSVPPRTGAERARLDSGRAPVIPEPTYGTQLQDVAVPGRAAEGRIRMKGSEFDLNWHSTVKHALRDMSVDGIAPAAAPSRRRTLWEIRDGYHCSICGTCLSFAELRKIAARAGLCFEPDGTEHGIHGHFVQLASKPGHVSKLMQKILDRKYRSAVGRFRRAKSESELVDFWNRAMAEGDVPGPYWALMTHPCTTRSLMVHAFGEVHMLSHLAGATNRADIRRLRTLEGERRELSEQLAAARQRLSEREVENRNLATAHGNEVRALHDQLRSAGRSRAGSALHFHHELEMPVP